MFFLNNFCIGVVPTNDWAPGEVTLWIFSLGLQRIKHNLQQQHFELNSLFFDFFADDFLMVSAELSSKVALVVYNEEWVDYEFSFYQCFYHFCCDTLELRQGLKGYY